MSAPIAVTQGLLDGSPVLLTFDFSADPIPINATDLFVQAVYRGQLGSETDGIAVGMIDVAEPTYILQLNGTDYVFKNNAWQIPAASDPQPESLTTVLICSGQWEIFSSSTPGLPAAHIARIAALRDFSMQNLVLRAAGISGQFDDIYDQWQGNQRQALDEKGTAFSPDPMSYGRSTVIGSYGAYSYQYVPPLPSSLPSPWGLPAPATAVSENIGAVIVPGITACPF